MNKRTKKPVRHASTYPAAVRRNVLAALKEAKPRLRTRQNGLGSNFICWAIPDYLAGSHLARCVVQDRLEGRSTVGQWLEQVAKIPEKQLTQKNLQAFRHRWLDELIREFSA